MVPVYCQFVDHSQCMSQQDLSFHCFHGLEGLVEVEVLGHRVSLVSLAVVSLAVEELLKVVVFAVSVVAVANIL